MNYHISFLAIVLFKALLFSSVSALDSSVIESRSSVDINAVIYTDELEKRMPVNYVEYCKPNLGIAEDKIDAKKGGKASGTGYLFSSRLRFKNKNAVEVFDNADSQLAALAKDAYEEMEQIWTSTNVPLKKRPTVMTAMFIGKEVYLSSSLKGLGEDLSPVWNMQKSLFLTGLPVGVKECMTKCQDDFRNRQGGEDLNIHRQRGACGECNAILQYFLANRGKKSCANSVFVTVKKEGERIQVVKPCGLDEVDDNPAATEKWGCALPVKICQGRSINNPATKFDVYAIGKMKQKQGWEVDAHYQASDRYHTTDQIKLPKELFEIP